MTCKFGISGAHRLACRGGKTKAGLKYLHVHCTRTMHPTPLLHSAPSRPCQGVPIYQVWCPYSLGQSFLQPKDPSSKRFSAPGACNLHPTEVTPPMDFKLVRYACDLRVWDRWRHPCAPQGREKMMRSKQLRVHCTCTLHPSPLLHMAPSRPCPGAPMYRVWCR